MVVRIEQGERAEWMLAHEALSGLAKARAQADFEEGQCLLAALHSAAHVHLGFGSFAEYIERLFGYAPRATQEKLRVAEALEELPEIGEALATGSVNWSTVRELTRVAIPKTEQEWLEAAQGRTIRQIEALVSGKAPGDRPNSPNRPEARRHVLRFDVSAETLATFREAMAKLRRGCDFPVNDDSALLLMARHLLGGPTDDGRASYQVSMTVCEHCGHGAQQAAGELVPVPPEVVEMAQCDAQHVGSTHVGAEATRATQTIPPRIRRQVVRRDEGRCVVPGCRHTHFVDVHHLETRADGGEHDPDNLVVLCSAHHRATHTGRLHIEGRVSSGLSFRHANGAEYGKPVAPKTAGVREKLFAALRGMGFGEGDTRRALTMVGADTDADLQTLLREALAILIARDYKSSK
jgi:hypothetical protein